MKTLKKHIRRLLFKFIHQQWNIAIAELNTDLTLKNVRWLKHAYSDRWFADPFIIAETKDMFTVLVEEYMRDEKKGRIACLTISKKDCSLFDNKTILDLPSHLSFPIYMISGNHIYVYPENGASGKTMYYEFKENSLNNPKLFSELPLADPVVFYQNDSYYLLYTIGDKGCNGNELLISIADKPMGPYTPYASAIFEDNIARRAGNIFEWNGRLISPAQVCNKQYGEGVSLQEIIFDDSKHIKFKEIKRLYPFNKEYSEGLHTYNVFNNYVVIDGYKYNSPFLRRAYYFFRSFLNKI